MIEIDGRDRRSDGPDDVGRIEPAAEADLDHRDLHVRPAKQLERQGGRGFEERRRGLQRALRAELLDRLADVAGGAAHRRGVHGPSVDDEALGQIDEVRRGIAGRSVAGAAERRVDHGRDRSLAVGAGDVNRPERALRVAEASEQRLYVFETELDPELFEAEQVREMVQLQLRCRLGHDRRAGGG